MLKNVTAPNNDFFNRKIEDKAKKTERYQIGLNFINLI